MKDTYKERLAEVKKWNIKTTEPYREELNIQVVRLRVTADDLETSDYSLEGIINNVESILSDLRRVEKLIIADITRGDVS